MKMWKGSNSETNFFIWEGRKKFPTLRWSTWAYVEWRLCFMSCLGNLFHRFSRVFHLMLMENFVRLFSLFLPFSQFEFKSGCVVRSNKTSVQLSFALKEKLSRDSSLQQILYQTHSISCLLKLSPATKVLSQGKYEIFSFKIKIIS